ncbi:MAG: glutathione S-transferase [Myxococcota bacterium]|jgi:glutathione S-transferase
MQSDSSHPELTLYYAPRCRAFTGLWLMEELGEPYVLESFLLASNRHKEPDYLALNPLGKVPLVVDGGIPVSEVGAIAAYLAERFPESGLAPPIGDPDRAAYLRWLFYVPGLLEPAMTQKLVGFEMKAASASWGSWEQTLAVARDAVTPGPYLLGERFSGVDILAASGLRFAVMFGAIPKEDPLAAYVARVQERPSFERASAIEQREGERFPPTQE